MTAYILEQMLILGICFLFYYYFLKQDTFFRRNRFYLLLSVLLALMLPMLEFGQAMPMENYILLPAFTVGLDQIPESMGLIESRLNESIPFKQYLIWIDWAGFLFCTGRLLLSFSKLAIVLYKHKAVLYKGFYLVRVKGGLPVCSFFGYVFVPEQMELETGDGERVLQHERVHVKEWHSLDIVFLELLKTVYWYNPLLYLYEREIKEQHEFQADKKVALYSSVKIYQQLIVKEYFRQKGLSFLNYFNQSTINTRLAMLQKRKSPAIMAWKAVFAIPLFALCIFIFSCQQQSATENKKENIEKNKADEKEANQKKEPIVKLDPSKNDSIKVDVYTSVEQQPEFKGGMKEFYNYLQKNLRYPKEARREGVEGKVFIQFIVMEDGSITNIKVMKGIGMGCDEEAVRVLKTSPKWDPGIVKGKAVNVKMVIPIVYKLG